MLKVVTVVAGGYSVKSIDTNRLPGFVIAINDSFIHMKRPPNVILTMDRLWTEYRWSDIVLSQLPFYCRATCLQNIAGARENEQVHIYDCDNKTAVFSSDPAILNGSNSGTCGINLAYQLKPDHLFLLGFDMQPGPRGEAHWYPPYPWAPNGGTKPGKYQSWANEFELIAKQFLLINAKVYNVSDRSLIRMFPVMQPSYFNAMNSRE